MPPALRILYYGLRWPALAYGAGEVTVDRITGRRQLRRWWPPAFHGWAALAYARHADQRFAWNEWCWAELARGPRAYTVTDSGALQFRNVWTPPPKPTGPKAVVAYAGQAPPTATTEDVVMIGTGPNGEQGVIVDQLGGLERVTFG
jgi:hypothetical protein